MQLCIVHLYLQHAEQHQRLAVTAVIPRLLIELKSLRP